MESLSWAGPASRAPPPILLCCALQLVNRMGMACDVFPAAAPLELDTLEEVEAVLKVCGGGKGQQV